ncbi:MAG: hypothetical protein HY328_11175 [Chloroflexi bacterium]|nr:hypothetical protein [Chloroflexota bacterium]
MRQPDQYHSLRDAVAAELEKERRRIHAEIHDYPPPIPACDAQFNHLLYLRARVAQEVRSAQAIPGSERRPEASESAIRQAITGSEILSATAKGRLLQELARASQPSLV